MRLEIPLTGTVLVEGRVHGGGRLEGDPDDVIRPINIDLGNVTCTMVDVDLDREIMIVDVRGARLTQDPGAERPRPTTPGERAAAVAHARGLIHGKSKAELYELSGSPRLKRPFKVSPPDGGEPE